MDFSARLSIIFLFLCVVERRTGSWTFEAHLQAAALEPRINSHRPQGRSAPPAATSCAEHNRHFASLYFCFPIPDFGNNCCGDGEVGNRYKEYPAVSQFSSFFSLFAIQNASQSCLDGAATSGGSEGRKSAHSKLHSISAEDGSIEAS
jgi:hypothetical protein